MDVLASGPLSVDEILDHLRLQSRDESSSQSVFSDDELKLALRQSVINSRNKYFRSSTYTLDYLLGTDTYTLPSYVESIVLITRERTANNNSSGANALSSTPLDQVVYSFRHFFSRETNRLDFTRSYPSGSFTIHYYQNIAVPISNRNLGAALTDSGTTMTLTDADVQLARVQLPAWFKIDDEIIKVSAITSNTSATIVRAQFDTTAAAHVDASTVSQVIFADTDAFYNYLYTECGRLLNAWRIQSGTSTDVAANVTSTRFFAQDKEEHLRRDRQAKKPTRVNFTRGRRPRRAL